MTHDELREKVAMAIWEAQCQHWQPYRAVLEADGKLCPFDNLSPSRQKELTNEATAAIAVVLEEAAQMIERRHGYGLSLQIAAEVRAMKGSPNAE